MSVERLIDKIDQITSHEDPLFLEIFQGERGLTPMEALDALRSLVSGQRIFLRMLQDVHYRLRVGEPIVQIYADLDNLLRELETETS